MDSDRTAEEKAELLKGFVKALRSESGRHVAMRETPYGPKVGAGAGDPGDVGWGMTTEADINVFLDKYEDALVAVYEGELDVVNEISEEEWPHFVALVEETESIDVGEGELQEVRGEGSVDG